MEDKEIFPQIKEILPQQGAISYEKKCVFHECILHKYLMRKIEGWSVKKFLEIERIEKYVLYAVTDFTSLFLADLDNNIDKNIETIICDKNAKMFQSGFKGRRVILPDEFVDLYEENKVEKIIIMSILHENEIIDELLKKNILLNDIISFVSVLYS